MSSTAAGGEITRKLIEIAAIEGQIGI